jgi:acid phosphatase family membrane protein YuiD
MDVEDTNGIGAIVAFVLGWLLAQGGKLLGDLLREKRVLAFREILDCMVRSGGMPSGHTASFVGLTTYLGMTFGFCSSIFALAACTTIIVIYDAVNVRYAVGQQGKLLNLIAVDGKRKYQKQKVVEGHTVPQAIIGGILGIIIGVIIANVF